jgi:hypothetical protein
MWERFWTTILFIFYGLGILGWFINLVLFLGLNFSAPYRAEIIRGIGVFTPAGALVGYLHIED